MGSRLSPLCGCFYVTDTYSNGMPRPSGKRYLPLVKSEVHGSIYATSSRSTLKQTFVNPSDVNIEKCTYLFPLYDGVSVVNFTCRIGSRVLRGVVNEKTKAKAIFDQAVSKGETAGLLEQSEQASDTFSTSLGNLPPQEKVHVEITFIGELKNDVDVDGIRYTIPTVIAPRYGVGPGGSASVGSVPSEDAGGISISINVQMPQSSPIQSIQSPSHPIAVSMGVLSSDLEAEPSLNKASTNLALGEAALEKDFVLMIKAKDTGSPKALLEAHPTIPGHRALMTTLVPKFSLPQIKPEIVFVADRSGSMQPNIPLLISAMRVFLKSLPVGVKFNVCSFGSAHSYLWPQSRAYTKETLAQATSHVNTFAADLGGTETLPAIQGTIGRRYGDIPLEIILLTDGDIWRQEDAFEYLNEASNKGDVRLFPLGIGNGVSHALVEGLARAGNGFAQAVQDGERIEGRVIRMLKGALSAHVQDYTLEVKYDADDDDFELIDSVAEDLKVLLSEGKADVTSEKDKEKSVVTESNEPAQIISLFDPQYKEDEMIGLEGPGAPQPPPLPEVPHPKLLQAPLKIPALFSFTRTTVYLLMSPKTIERNPTSVILRATSAHGPLCLEIPVEKLPHPSETIHQLAARKATLDLEEGRGWIHEAEDACGRLLIKERFASRFDELVEREAVRLGTQFQVANRWCSFVAVEANTKSEAEQKRNETQDYIGGHNVKTHSHACLPATFAHYDVSTGRPQMMLSAVPYGSAANLLGQQSSSQAPNTKQFAKEGLFGGSSMQSFSWDARQSNSFGSTAVPASLVQQCQVRFNGSPPLPPNPSFSSSGQRSRSSATAASPTPSSFGSPATLPFGSSLFGASAVPASASSIVPPGGLFNSSFDDSATHHFTSFAFTAPPGEGHTLATSKDTPAELWKFRRMTDAEKVLELISLQDFEGAGKPRMRFGLSLGWRRKRRSKRVETATFG